MKKSGAIIIFLVLVGLIAGRLAVRPNTGIYKFENYLLIALLGFSRSLINKGKLLS